ncbi:MAG: hypothetical protein B6U88_01635 [Candidatus Aenigmarchaeota archaeon ex4484_56]|nr:MAG: hypothetical protein B6U88_01635 [Candidatus Aenigmarchaeota archaeon ex4484_56]
MVEVHYLEDHPAILAALGVNISNSDRDWKDIYKICREDFKESEKLVKDIVKKHKHNILLDFTSSAIILDNISRLGAIYFWRNVSAPNLVSGGGIERSFRVVEPRYFREETEDLGNYSLEVYNSAIEDGVPYQDARYVIPEGALTTIIFSSTPRYYSKLANTLKESPLEEIKEIGESIEKILREKEIPQTDEKVFESWDFFESKREDTNPPFKYKVDGSMAMFAQLVRERQALCNMESFENISKKGEFVIPPTFTEKVTSEYRELAKEALEEQISKIDKGEPTFAYPILLGQKASADVEFTHAGKIESSKKRCCGVAQWEIRDNFAIPVTQELYKQNIKETGPRCYRENKCVEPPTFKKNKSECPVFEKYEGKSPESLEEVISLLYTPYEIFKV